MSGSSLATAATIGNVAAPTMTKMGYDKRLTFGSIAAGGTLGILIPPSTVLIMYGGLTGVSIGQLFIAGVVPGLLLMALFFVVIAVSSIWFSRKSESLPIANPNKTIEPSYLQSVLSVTAVALLIGLVLGGIYAGWFSPTESAGIGAGAALVLGLVFRRFAFKQIWEALGSAVMVAGTILFIVGAASMLSYLLNYLGYTRVIADSLANSGVSVGIAILLVCVFYVLLGLFIESTSLIVMTVPIIYPILSALGVDGVWLGILIVILVEIGLITPPVGMNLFVLSRVKAGQNFNDIAIGAAPYAVVMLVLVILINIFPEIVTWLPNMSSPAAS